MKCNKRPQHNRYVMWWVNIVFCSRESYNLSLLQLFYFATTSYACSRQ